MGLHSQQTCAGLPQPWKVLLKDQHPPCGCWDFPVWTISASLCPEGGLHLAQCPQGHVGRARRLRRQTPLSRLPLYPQFAHLPHPTYQLCGLGKLLMSLSLSLPSTKMDLMPTRLSGYEN